MKKEKPKVEFRNHVMPVKSPILALQGKKWTMTYEDGNDRLHYHNYFEIGFCRFGQGIMRIGEDEMRFCGGEFTIIPPGFAHSTNSDTNTISSWEYLVVDMDKILQEKYEKNPTFIEEIKQKINVKAFMGSNEEEYAVVSKRIQEILEIFRKEEKFYFEEAKVLLESLIINIVRINEEEFDIYKKEGQKTAFDTAAIVNYINEHYMEELRIAALAEQNHFSETHFRRVFTTYMGMGPLEYINKVRVHAACEYLRTTDKSIVSIAGLCGFTNLSTFNRNFSSIMGKSPCQWRKEIKRYQ